MRKVKGAKSESGGKRKYHNEGMLDDSGHGSSGIELQDEAT